jgi:hypothetical protein
MGPPSYMRSVVERNVVMRRIPVSDSRTYKGRYDVTYAFARLNKDVGVIAVGQMALMYKRLLRVIGQHVGIFWQIFNCKSQRLRVFVFPPTKKKKRGGHERRGITLHHRRAALRCAAPHVAVLIFPTLYPP